MTKLKAKDVSVRTTGMFGRHNVGDIVQGYLVLCFDCGDALVYCPRNKLAGSCLMLTRWHEKDQVWEQHKSIYINQPEIFATSKSILDMFHFPKLPTERELRAIKMLEKKGYKVVKE